MLRKLGSLGHVFAEATLRKRLQAVDAKIAKFQADSKLKAKPWFSALEPLALEAPLGSDPLDRTLSLVLRRHLVCLLASVSSLRLVSDAHLEWLTGLRMFTVDLAECLVPFEKLQVIFRFVLNQVLSIIRRGRLEGEILSGLTPSGLLRFALTGRCHQ